MLSGTTQKDNQFIYYFSAASLKAQSCAGSQIGSSVKPPGLSVDWRAMIIFHRVAFVVVVVVVVCCESLLRINLSAIYISIPCVCEWHILRIDLYIICVCACWLGWVDSIQNKINALPICRCSGDRVIVADANCVRTRSRVPVLLFSHWA